MKQRIVTVVGGTGFVGRGVVGEFVRRGYSVHVLCRNPESEEALALKTMGFVGQVVLSRADVGKDGLSKVMGLAGAPVAVVNLVGLLFEHGRQNFAAIHAQGAERVAKAAKAVGAGAFVQISALGVDKASGSKYARTKMMGEKAVLAAFPEATILRPSVVFGAEDHFFNQFAAMATVSPFLPLIGGGRTRFQPVYAGDVATAVVEAVENYAARGQTYELGGPRVYTFREILEYVLKETGRNASLVDLPFPVASLVGRFAEWLPTPPLTHDQVTLLHYDNVVSEGAKTLADLGISPSSVEAVVPRYLQAFRKPAPEFAA